MAIDALREKFADNFTDNVTDNKGKQSALARREAERFVSELGKLKGSYVKIGQMMALFGEHFLPPVLTEALHALDNNTQALPWQQIRPHLMEQLGEDFDRLDIDPEPIAAASLSQLHKARIRNSGELICLKVQYPGLAEVIDTDFDAVVRLLILSRWLKTGRELDEWIESLREQLHFEIDYQREARLTEQAYQLITQQQLSALKVPAVIAEFNCDQVLALEFIEGFSVTAAEVQALAQPRRNALAQTMLELFFREVFEWGLLQTDPNFGNYLICLQDRRLREANDTLVLLDYGAAIEMPQQQLQALQQVIVSGLQQDTGSLSKALMQLGWLKDDASEYARDTFAQFCIDLLEPLRPADQLPAQYLNDSGEYCWASSQLMQRAGKQGASKASSRHFSPPARDFILMARKLTGVFTFISVLRAEFNAWPMAERYIKQWQQQTGSNANNAL